jgi:hypothetical protein
MEAMNEARLLDLQDRYVNSKCTKYMLRNDQQKAAKDTISLFIKVIFSKIRIKHKTRFMI